MFLPYLLTPCIVTWWDNHYCSGNVKFITRILGYNAVLLSSLYVLGTRSLTFPSHGLQHLFASRLQCSPFFSCLFLPHRCFEIIFWNYKKHQDTFIVNTVYVSTEWLFIIKYIYYNSVTWIPSVSRPNFNHPRFCVGFHRIEGCNSVLLGVVVSLMRKISNSGSRPFTWQTEIKWRIQ